MAETVWAHPTISESIKEAADDALGVGLHLPPRKVMRIAAAMASLGSEATWEHKSATALEALRGLGTPAEMRALADRGYGPASPPRVNAHIHLPPNFSAFDTRRAGRDAGGGPADRRVGRQQLLRLTTCTASSWNGLAQLGIFPLFGLEIIAMQADLRDAGVRVNDPGNPGKTYLCGKGITRFDDMSPEAARLIERDSPQ